MRKRHGRENRALRLLIQCAAILAACIAGIILFMLLIWWRGQQAEPQTDEQVAAQMQQEQKKAEPLIIETTEPATEGSIIIYTQDGAVYGYFGKIDIKNDGKDGSQIDIELKGWLVGETHEKVESEANNEQEI